MERDDEYRHRAALSSDCRFTMATVYSDLLTSPADGFRKSHERVRVHVYALYVN